MRAERPGRQRERLAGSGEIAVRPPAQRAPAREAERIRTSSGRCAEGSRRQGLRRSTAAGQGLRFPTLATEKRRKDGAPSFVGFG